MPDTNRWRRVLDRLYRSILAAALAVAVVGPTAVAVTLLHDLHVRRVDGACLAAGLATLPPAPRTPIDLSRRADPCAPLDRELHPYRCAAQDIPGGLTPEAALALSAWTSVEQKTRMRCHVPFGVYVRAWAFTEEARPPEFGGGEAR